ncbi:MULTISPECIES: ROK family protein [Streptococcus]|uniref:ROK family protein n=1 Tax=Streptococcus caledonicus TaxID=2614158 RepID=A0ABW0UC61_9STRE|nr:ROK family protein [Streptococcus sp. S784/96/1]
MKDYLSIDIGGTQIKYALIDRSGNIIEKSNRSTPDNLPHFLEAIDSLVTHYKSRIRGVAISCPGKVDSKEGIIYFGGSLPFLHGLNLPEYLLEHYDLPTTVINDGKAAALSELWRGNLQGIENGLALILGTGVGGGIISKGELLQGTHFQAGELSFTAVPVRPFDFQNIYGVKGSAVRMIETCAEILGLEDTKDGMTVFKAISQKDGRVYPIFRDYCQGIAYLIYNVQAVLDMARVVVGGGISVQEIVIEEIRNQYQIILQKLGDFSQMITPVEIMPCAFHNEANLLGALYQFLLTVEGNH